MSEILRADVRYLNAEWKDRGEMPRIYSKESRHANTSPREAEILDARPLCQSGQLDLDRNGFVLIQHESSVHDFSEPDRVTAQYLGEMEALIRQVTGAEEAFAFRGLLIRREDPKTFFDDGYALYLHVDFSESSRDTTRRE